MEDCWRICFASTPTHVAHFIAQVEQPNGKERERERCGEGEMAYSKQQAVSRYICMCKHVSACCSCISVPVIHVLNQFFKFLQPHPAAQLWHNVCANCLPTLLLNLTPSPPISCPLPFSFSLGVGFDSFSTLGGCLPVLSSLGKAMHSLQCAKNIRLEYTHTNRKFYYLEYY